MYFQIENLTLLKLRSSAKARIVLNFWAKWSLV